ncbi:ABC transporter permease [Piscinibacter gummiphilus]|uniref:ABC transporter permease n=1 Tax=Piscinibacter gummiphilus TaxID=946333 RepID=A0ABZ0CMP9_9BURK|nr:ABC transporter permease [Piscinibacter gummiphilus]WOB06245.1 ABC transporter permease [Piscinibacter gummiphilus]
MADTLLQGLPVSALRSAAPLLLVLLGECLTQRVGRINLGVEGQMLVGAVAGYGVTAVSGQPWLGMVAGAAAGALLSAVYALLTVAARADQFASGLAVLMLGFGVSAYAGSGLVGLRIEGFALGAGGTTPTLWLAVALVPLIGLWLYGTRTGLVWRAVGESPPAASAAGITPWKVIVAGIAAGGVLSGLGGAALSIDHTRTWAEGMTAGRGLIAVGLVIVARWNPWLTLPAALLFGLAEALSLRLQAGGSAVPAHLLHTLPYLASLVVFAVTCARLKGGGGPEALRAVFAR